MTGIEPEDPAGGETQVDAATALPVEDDPVADPVEVVEESSDEAGAEAAAAADAEADERRRAPRKGVRLNKLIAANLVIDGESSSAYLHLVDISEGGLRINGDLELPGDTPFELALSLEAFGAELASEFGPQSFHVRVVWQKQLVGGMWVAGLQFLEQTETNRAVVARILERASPAGRRLRFRLNRVLGVEVGGADESRWIYPLALDLSVEGMRIRLDEELTVGESFPLKIFLEFELPTIEVTAEVMWQERMTSGRYQVGLKFTEMDDQAAQTIKDYIDRCLEQDHVGSV